METGCDIELVRGQVPESLRCSHCKNVLRDPFQSSCGHRFCDVCLQSLLRASTMPTCPVDQVSLIKEETFRDIFAEREILSLPVICPTQRKSKGCEWTGELRSLKEHEDVCEFVQRPCPNGCENLVSNRQLAEHMQCDCSARLECCGHCQKDFPRYQMNKHKDSCTEAPSLCPNRCTVRAVPCSKMADHLRVCPKQTVKCMYSTMGCDFEGERCDLPAHCEASIAYHLQICYKQAQHKQDTIDFLTKENCMLTDRCMSYEDTLIRLQLMAERSISTNSGRKSTVSPGERATRDLDIQIEQEMAVSLREFLPVQEQDLSTIERSVALHESQLSDFHVRQHFQNVKMSNGVLVWKIINFCQCQQEAISGKMPSLYSPPFYTSPAGYKVCARLYPNGDSVGRGTHLSFFFIIMKGEFDAILPWPFHQNVNFCLLDQQRKTPCDIIERFAPDPSSSSFQRREQEMNVASGCPLFAPLSVLNESSYLRDNTLYLKVSIHP